jgi:hypothetical protein
MRKKKFDCVEMKLKGARTVYEATRNMTVDEEVEYWRCRTEEARRWLEGGTSVNSANRTAAV